ncbi:hypothetical protein B0H19DRAFT_1083665 [Mycena capillaripes]|nr:hypothetical protein B0H19DRAFT_1083665 [Mycena capillaripes]
MFSLCTHTSPQRNGRQSSAPPSAGKARFGLGSEPFALNAEPEPGVRFGHLLNFEPELVFGFDSAFEHVGTRTDLGISEVAIDPFKFKIIFSQRLTCSQFNIVESWMEIEQNEGRRGRERH